MSHLDDQFRAELKAIRKQERRDKNRDQANRARAAAWVSYIDTRVTTYQLAHGGAEGT